MDSAQLQALMMERVETMPNKARRVVEYLLSNMREAAFRSIGDVAEDLNVSKAQLVRVARMLGFEGYSELKDALQKAILEQVNPAAMLAKVSSSEESLPDTIYRMEHANLDDTWSQLSAASVSTFCDMVQRARNIYCIGWGISSMVAESLQVRLRVMNLNSFLLKRGTLTLHEQVRVAGKEDLLVVCELPSYVVEVTESVETAHNNGCKVISITDSPAAPVCRFAELSMYVSASSPTFGSSIIGPLFLVHVITSVLAIRMGDRAKKALEEQAKFLHDERIFHPVFGLRY